MLMLCYGLAARMGLLKENMDQGFLVLLGVGRIA